MFLKYIYKLIQEFYESHYIKRIYYYVKKNRLQLKEKNIFIITTPEYGNLGDHAIAIAEKKFCKKNFDNYNIIEIPDSEFDKNILFIKKNIKKDDMVFLIGGGNFGTLYPKSEYIRRSTIKNIKNNIIVMFPQSFASKSTKVDMLELNRTKKIYSKHNKLILFAREEKSYLKMKSIFCKNIVCYAPDVVMTLNVKLKEPRKNKNIIFCIRDDVESSLDKNILDFTKKFLENKGYNIVSLSTEKYKTILPEEREKEVFEMIQNMKDSCFVITDRLHGMIFSCLAGTPCLAFDNTTKKVSGVYNWFVNEKIFLYDENKDLKEQLIFLLKSKMFNYNYLKYNNILNNELKKAISIVKKKGK